MRRIKLAQVDSARATKEIGDWVVNEINNIGASGCVIGLSGGVDSTTTAALVKTAFDEYNARHGTALELVGYILPSKTNDPKDTEDGIDVAERLGIRYEVQNIEGIVRAYEATNPEAVANKFHKGNMMSRIRANVLSTKSTTEKKSVVGTGNKDEDGVLGYYTLFGDGAVHLRPIANLPKRLVRQLAEYHGFPDIAQRIPTAGLEPGQSDFKDLGYSYDVVELVTEGFEQGFSRDELYTHEQIVPLVKKEIVQYEAKFGKKKFDSVDQVVNDIARRNMIAKGKERIINPPMAPVTLEYI